jgi:hypothetical protein
MRQRYSIATRNNTRQPLKRKSAYYKDNEVEDTNRCLQKMRIDRTE